MTRLALILPLLCVFLSCDPQLHSGPDLYVGFEFIDSPTIPLSDSARAIMSGVYQVEDGINELGDLVVGKWIGNRWCLFSQFDVVQGEFAGGSTHDSSINLYGYVRNLRSGSGARAKLQILRDHGSLAMLSGRVPASVGIQGTISDRQKIQLRRVRGVNNSTFHILAHRGGGRNSDRLGMSENSVAMIRSASILGATGIEIDVKRTRDDKLIVFHDDSFSPRTVQGAYLLGDVENYDLEQIKLLGSLIYGEQIPTLTEALNAVIDDTHLSLVWLDIKAPRAVELVVEVQRASKAYAALKGRNVEILLGIPSEDILKAYNDLPSKDSTWVLVELSSKTALSLEHCRAWAPIWTLDPSAAEISSVRATGRLVFTWTVDLRESIINYQSRVDGILSNYPSLVTALHDLKN